VSAPQSALRSVQLRWNAKLPDGLRFLGDHWERGYADWNGADCARTRDALVFLASDGQRTHGYGVKTGASSIAFWRTDSHGISLFLDVRTAEWACSWAIEYSKRRTSVSREGYRRRIGVCVGAGILPRAVRQAVDATAARLRRQRLVLRLQQSTRTLQLCATAKRLRRGLPTTTTARSW
jgi:hypothetical protein